MKVLTLKEIKQNSRIEGDDEDALLMMIGDTAEEAVANAMRRSWDEVIRANGGLVPKPLRHACLMLADHWYCNRGATSSININRLPLGARELISPYVRLL
ncbi:MAG: head-tail connector protein [Prevotellaceae bacterium]|nr:head-tail connector protein [Prevotellaceae bacterium]